MTGKIMHLCALLCLAASLAAAQQTAASTPAAPGPDPLGQSFFPPELVMQNQQAIGLTDEQRNSLRTEIRDAQIKFTDLQWKLQDEVEKMAALVKETHVDEQQALAQLDRVLSVEREVKRAQIALLVHIKNRLTPEQQARLRQLRSESAGHP